MTRRTVLRLDNPSPEVTNVSEVLESTPTNIPVDQSDSTVLLLDHSASAWSSMFLQTSLLDDYDYDFILKIRVGQNIL